ncbi:hypothetical protein LEMLEM_LOCUS12668 [Lemmus lemmus]
MGLSVVKVAKVSSKGA